jgi:hypothetical protein
MAVLSKDKGKSFFEHLFKGDVPKEVINLGVSSTVITKTLKPVAPNYITPVVETEES